MLRLCHSRAPASEGTSKLERSTGIDCMREERSRARRQHSARALAGAVRAVTSRRLRTTLTPKLGARGYDGAGG